MSAFCTDNLSLGIRAKVKIRDNDSLLKLGAKVKVYVKNLSRFNQP